jgi:hypothetical protein
MYPHKVLASMDAKERKPQHLPGFYLISWISLDILKLVDGGRGGIRTPDTLSGTPVFKTGAINHSATLPF